MHGLQRMQADEDQVMDSAGSEEARPFFEVRFAREAVLEIEGVERARVTGEDAVDEAGAHAAAGGAE